MPSAVERSRREVSKVQRGAHGRNGTGNSNALLSVGFLNNGFSNHRFGWNCVGGPPAKLPKLEIRAGEVNANS